MPVSLSKSDLFSNTKAQVYAHGTNTYGAMGAGIAVEFKRRFPEMYEEYREDCKKGLYVPSTVMMWTKSKPMVANLMTQGHKNSNYRPIILPARYEDVFRCLEIFFYECKQFGLTEVAMPMIGSGLGGLRWELIEVKLRELCPNDVNVTVHYL